MPRGRPRAPGRSHPSQLPRVTAAAELSSPARSPARPHWRRAGRVDVAHGRAAGAASADCCSAHAHRVVFCAMAPTVLQSLVLVVATSSASSDTTHAAFVPHLGRVSGATRFAGCGDRMCPNMTAQVAQIVDHAATIDSVLVYSGGAAPQYNTANFGACYVGSKKIPAVEGNAAFQAAFRFPSTREPQAGICTPASDAVVTAWASPLRAAGVSILPVIQGQYRGSNWTMASLDQNFLSAAVHVALHFGFAGWALDVRAGQHTLPLIALYTPHQYSWIRWR